MIQFHPYSVALAVSGLVTLIVFHVTRQRNAPGSLALSVMLFDMFLWQIAYALTWMFVPLGLKTFFLKFMYLGVLSIPGLFLIFALRITQRDGWINFRNIALFFVEPVIMMFFVWIAPQFVFASIEPVVKDGYQIVEVTRGTMFWVNTVYSYFIIFISLFLLGISYRNANSIFKKQYLYVILGSILPFGLSIYTQTKNFAFNDLDLAPVAFGISGMVYAYAIFRHQFMDLIPIARSHLIESMRDGVLVLDAQGRIVDINPAMRDFLDEDPASFIGRNVSDVLDLWNGNMEHLINGQETRTEFRLPNKTFRYLDLRVTPLYDENQKLNGRLIVFRDITDRKEVEKDLHHAMDRMREQLIEINLLQSKLRDQAIRDPLTNIFNRRYLDETLERELARASREDYPLCIMMMDIDHFKGVNDTYGHEAGDVILKNLAKTATGLSRQGDFLCRFGGEEFVLVMPNIDINVAKERATTLNRAVSSQFVPFGRFNLNITISMGLSSYPANGTTKDELLRAADWALYSAKRAGRNRVHVYRNDEEKKLGALITPSN